MKRYPKYLKVLPQFYGFDFFDIGALVFSLHLATVLDLQLILAIFLVVLCLLFTKFIRKNLDFKSFFLKKTKELDLSYLKKGKR